MNNHSIYYRERYPREERDEDERRRGQDLRIQVWLKVSTSCVHNISHSSNNKRCKWKTKNHPDKNLERSWSSNSDNLWFSTINWIIFDDRACMFVGVEREVNKPEWGGRKIIFRILTRRDEGTEHKARGVSNRFRIFKCASAATH